MKVAIGTTNRAKVGAVESILMKHEPAAEIIAQYAASQVSEQPFSTEETRSGAIHRARNVLEATGADMGFGLEGGVHEIDGILYCVNWGAVALANGHVYTAQGASFMLPTDVANELRAGKELGPVMDAYTKKEQTRQHEGAVGIFTNGLMNRKEMFEHIVTLLIGQVYFYETKAKL